MKTQNKINIIGGGKTGYNLYKVFTANNIDSQFFYFKNEFGANKNGGVAIDMIHNYSLEENIIITSETAFEYFKDKFKSTHPQLYYLRNKKNYKAISEHLKTKTINEINLDNISYPVFMKPKESGTKKVPFKTKIIRNAKEFKLNSKYLSDCFVQEYLDNNNYDQIDIGGYFTGHKDSLVSFKEKNQYPEGVASYITLYTSENCERIRENIAYFLNTLSFRGFVEIEFKRNKINDDFFLMDINPRPWGSFFFYLSAIKNLREVLYLNELPDLVLADSWINIPRLIMSNLKGRNTNPPIKHILMNKISYEPYYF